MATAKRNFFYKRLPINVSVYSSKAQFIFPFTATHVVIYNRSASSDILFSFNGFNLDGELFAKDGPLTMDGIALNRLWFKSPSGGPDVQVWAWRK